jgi:hypothetical protein
MLEANFASRIVTAGTGLKSESYSIGTVPHCLRSDSFVLDKQGTRHAAESVEVALAAFDKLTHTAAAESDRLGPQCAGANIMICIWIMGQIQILGHKRRQQEVHVPLLPPSPSLSFLIATELTDASSGPHRRVANFLQNGSWVEELSFRDAEFSCAVFFRHSTGPRGPRYDDSRPCTRNRYRPCPRVSGHAVCAAPRWWSAVGASTASFEMGA